MQRIVITGCTGQLGKALVKKYPEAVALSRTDMDITDKKQVDAFDWSKCDILINAAAYVNGQVIGVDGGMS